MALSINDRLETVDGGRYVPKASITRLRDAHSSHYDIAAAFRAFRADSDTNSNTE